MTPATRAPTPPALRVHPGSTRGWVRQRAPPHVLLDSTLAQISSVCPAPTAVTPPLRAPPPPLPASPVPRARLKARITRARQAPPAVTAVRAPTQGVGHFIACPVPPAATVAPPPRPRPVPRASIPPLLLQPQPPRASTARRERPAARAPLVATRPMPCAPTRPGSPGWMTAPRAATPALLSSPHHPPHSAPPARAARLAHTSCLL